jgi:hypothetical protein
MLKKALWSFTESFRDSARHYDPMGSMTLSLDYGTVIFKIEIYLNI